VLCGVLETHREEQGIGKGETKIKMEKKGHGHMESIAFPSSGRVGE